MKLLIRLLIILVMVGLAAFTNRDDESSAPEMSNDNVSISLINSAFMNGEYSLVLTLGESFLAEFPNSEDALQLVGWAYLKEGGVIQAKECFQRLIALNPNRDNAYVGLGATYRKSGDLKSARKSYKKAIEAYPENSEAYSSLVVVALLEEDVAGAVAYGEKAWGFVKDNPSVLANMAIAYHFQGDTAQCRLFVERARASGYHGMDGLRQIIAGERTIGTLKNPAAN